MKKWEIRLQHLYNRCKDIQYTDHLEEYLQRNILLWDHWNRLPITITNLETNISVVVNDINYKDIIKGVL